ncbi:MAG: bifunctional DNA primase/polymerase [Pseudonocardiales bacterium]|nr:bifunctional DNA primase/polymerase [Pseudonocardiales bacterium]MBV9032468.1 bifunctional DNA primase/polymerase [Pseudonocardiales bacterium]
MTTLDDPTPTVDAIRHSLRGWALHFAARGWHVFPITPGTKKPPVIQRWEAGASTDPDLITRWWRHTPYSIGIATGPSGLVVIDLDTPKPGEPVPERWAALGTNSGAGVLRALARTHGTTVTPTYAVTTPSGGRHLYYTAPPGTPLRNTHDRIGWKIDTRAHGGYVVAPGSPVPPSGYELIDDREPVELPGWLHQALTPKPPTGISAATQTVTTNPSGYACAAVRGECQRVRTAPRGQHNAVLCRAAYALGQLIGADLLDEATVRTELTTAATPLISADCDCTPREIARVITAGLAAGVRNPRRATPRRDAA